MVWGAIAGAAVSALGGYLTNKSNKSTGNSGGAGGATGDLGSDTAKEASRMKDKAAEQQLRMAIEDAKRDMYYKPLIDGLKKTSETYSAMGR